MNEDTIGTMHEPKPIMAKLKKRFKHTHAELSGLPYFKALMDHDLPVDSYVTQLRAMNVIYSVLETELSSATDSRVNEVWREEMRKVPLLQADLDFFEPRQIVNAPTAIEDALHVVEAIRLCQVTNPYALLGCLYVMEGTTLGNWVHRPDIVNTFHLDSLDGAHYYSGYGESGRTHWQGFAERMNNALIDESHHEPVIEAARDVFSSLITLHAKLFPL